MGRLIVVPTPIGNLEDITLRALRVLRESPLILAEDTRHTRQLLRHFEIEGKLLSYHQHNKRERLGTVLRRLEETDVALVSNAGMPVVADPGFELVSAAIEAGIEVEVLPGASAVITAVVAAALPAPGFVFAGFLPRKSGDRRKRLGELAALPYSLVFYEAPHRLTELLEDIEAVLGDRSLVMARELTKLHEEVLRTTVSGLRARYREEEPRGEVTLVVAGANPEPEDRRSEARDALRERALAGEGARTSVDEVSARFGMPRNEVYELWVQVSRGGQEGDGQ
ncbi:MAG: 16S rRNA (cytidine(1402)-2'-O)-methyltransferase [Chloroflexota bacterium]